MNKKMLFLFNIKAGTSGVRSRAADIIDIFTKGGYDVLAHPSQSASDMEDIVRERGEEFDVVVTCGGDGSLNDTINGLMALDDPPALGYIPTGTMNDFASSHHLNHNMMVAASDIVHGELIYTDVGRFNGRYFSYVSAFGAFTDVSYDTPQATKNLLGKTAYLLEAVKRIPLLSSNHMKIQCDDLEFENDFIYGMASNSLTVAGLPLDRKGDLALDDGYFNVVLIRKGISEILNAQVMLNAVLMGLEKSKHIDYIRTKSITITSDEPIPWTLDGEFGGEVKEAKIECMEKKLKLIVPKWTVDNV
ncbi:MAG: YegS/Rv2252/BmrU family lipid kinase [Firmicutes bacterium]|nr:YegS/Rv2252/BmrU family lipid kinase [Bacillota bacterium]